MRYGTIAVAATALGVWAAPASGQVPASPRELGMGGAYVGVARGYESVLLAPANLGLPDAPRWSFGFPQMATSLTLHGPEFTDLVDLAEFDDLTSERQNELLSLIPLNGTEGAFSLRAPLAAISVGGVGAAVQYVSTGSHTLSRDLAELFLEGYEEGRTDYAVGNTAGQRASYYDFALGYGHRIGPVSIGATGHYIRGGSIVRTRLFEPRVYLEEQEIEVDYVGVLARGGSGYGVDVGAAFQPSPALTVSATVSNAVSGMTWSEDLRVRELTLDRELIEAKPMDIFNRYENSEVALDVEGSSLHVFETAEGLYDEAYFPTVARFGLAWAPTSSTHVGLDFHRKLTDGRLADDWDQRFAVGIQQSLPIVKLRAGYAAGNDGGSLLGGGLSIGPLDLGVGRYQRANVDGARTRGWIATFGLGVAQTF